MTHNLAWATQRDKGCFSFSQGKGPWPTPPGIILGLDIVSHLVQPSQGFESVIDELPSTVSGSIYLALPILGSPTRTIKQAFRAQRHRAKSACQLYNAVSAERAILRNEVIGYSFTAKDGIAPGMNKPTIGSVYHCVKALATGENQEGIRFSDLLAIFFLQYLLRIGELTE